MSGLAVAIYCFEIGSTRLNSSHDQISYAVFCLKKKKVKFRLLGVRARLGRTFQKTDLSSCGNCVVLSDAFLKSPSHSDELVFGFFFFLAAPHDINTRALPHPLRI